MSSPSPTLSAIVPRLPDWLLRNRNFVLLWAGYGVAAIGDHLSEIALLHARGGMERDDATRVQALITFGFFLPFVLLGPLAGWWSDRFSRKTTMVVADLVRALIVWNLALLVPALMRWFEPDGKIDPHGWGDLAIVLPLALIGAVAAFFSPARQSMLPTLIRDDQLVRANALISALGTIGAILSAVLGGLLLASLGATWNYHTNALTFLLSAAFVASINLRRSRAVAHAPLEGVLAPIASGFRYVASHRRVLQMILLGTLFWAAAGVVISVVPAIVRAYFGADYSAAGLFRGIMGIGLACGAAVMTIFGAALPLQLAVTIALGAAGMWVGALALAHSLALGKLMTGVCLLGIGGAGAALLVSIMSTLQRLVPDRRRGRIFGVSDMCTMGAMVTATGVIGLPRYENLDGQIGLLLTLTALAFFAATGWAIAIYSRGRRWGPVVSAVMQLVRFYGRFWLRVERRGICTVPTQGPAILASNHISGVDPLAIITVVPHRLVAWLVEEGYYRNPIAGWFMWLVDCVPINRRSPGVAFYRRSLRVLESGGVLGVFPEGRIPEAGEDVSGARLGVSSLALHTGATVIPVHVSGATPHASPFVSIFLRHRMCVRFGRAVDLSAFRGRAREREAQQAAAEAIMRSIRELGASGSQGAQA